MHSDGIKIKTKIKTRDIFPDSGFRNEIRFYSFGKRNSNYFFCPFRQGNCI